MLRVSGYKKIAEALVLLPFDDIIGASAERQWLGIFYAPSLYSLFRPRRPQRSSFIADPSGLTP